MEEIKIINGNIAIDDRGELIFANEFDFKGVKRFYMVKNHKQGFVRAWHAHKKEAKYAIVVSGAALVAAVKIDNWETPSKNLEVFKTILSSKKPSILYIPAGHANGFMTLTEDTRIIFFSTSSLEESKNDDIRFDSRYWDVWTVTER